MFRTGFAGFNRRRRELCSTIPHHATMPANSRRSQPWRRSARRLSIVRLLKLDGLISFGRCGVHIVFCFFVQVGELAARRNRRKVVHGRGGLGQGGRGVHRRARGERDTHDTHRRVAIGAHRTKEGGFSFFPLGRAKILLPWNKLLLLACQVVSERAIGRATAPCMAKLGGLSGRGRSRRKPTIDLALEGQPEGGRSVCLVVSLFHPSCLSSSKNEVEALRTAHFFRQPRVINGPIKYIFICIFISSFRLSHRRSGKAARLVLSRRIFLSAAHARPPHAVLRRSPDEGDVSSTDETSCQTDALFPAPSAPDTRLETRSQQVSCGSANCGGRAALTAVVDFLRQLGVVVEVGLERVGGGAFPRRTGVQVVHSS